MDVPNICISAPESSLRLLNSDINIMQVFKYQFKPDVLTPKWICYRSTENKAISIYLQHEPRSTAEFSRSEQMMFMGSQWMPWLRLSKQTDLFYIYSRSVHELRLELLTDHSRQWIVSFFWETINPFIMNFETLETFQIYKQILRTL